jgi:hypothetical protein
MDADWIITAFVLIDTVLDQFDHRSHRLAHVPDSEIILVAVIAAPPFKIITSVLCALSGRSATFRVRSRLVASIVGCTL